MHRPHLHIRILWMQFAQEVRNYVTTTTHQENDESTEDEESKEDDKGQRHTKNHKERSAGSTPINKILVNVNKPSRALHYPILSKYSIPLDDEHIANGMLQELTKLTGNNRNEIRYKHVNNLPALLLPIPKTRMYYWFNRHIKANNVVDMMINFIVEGSETANHTAAKRIMKLLGNIYKDSFSCTAES